MKRCGFSLAGLLVVILVVMALCAAIAQATALTAARDTRERDGDRLVIGVATNTQIFAGAMVALNSSGYAVPASDSASLNVIGCAQATVDNRVNASGAGTDGTFNIEVRRGVFRWVNGDSFADSDIGELCFVEDDQTVQKAASASQDIIAGVIVDVDSDGVWVDTYDIGAQGASAPSTLAVSGNSTMGGTLTVSGDSTLRGTVTITNMALTAQKIQIAAASGNITTKGALDLTGAATVRGVASLTNLSNNIVVPTSAAGLTSGAIWNSNGVPAIAP